MELADLYEDGAKANRVNPMPFRRQVTVFRGAAANTAIQFAESLHRFQDADKDAQIALKFDYPTGSPNPPEELKKVSKAGILLPPAEVENLQRVMLQRGVLLSLGRALGTGEDAAKAQEAFKTGQVARQSFLLGMAAQLQEQAQLFGPKMLDQPNRLKLLCREAKEALAAVPPSKTTKELSGKIEKLLKSARVTT
jgi:hypothetical protein